MSVQEPADNVRGVNLLIGIFRVPEVENALVNLRRREKRLQTAELLTAAISSQLIPLVSAHAKHLKIILTLYCMIFGLAEAQC